MGNGYGLKNQQGFLLLKYWLKNLLIFSLIVVSIAGCSTNQLTNNLQITQNISSKIKSSDFPSLRNPSYLCEIIKKLRDVDQESRILVMANGKDSDLKTTLKKIDYINQSIVDFILTANNGWLSFKKVGKECEDNLWLLVQHAPDLFFQEKILKEMNRLRMQGMVQEKCYAYLYDRVAVRSNKNQLYGTQLYYAQTMKKWVLYPIEKQSLINVRRKAIGLEAIEDYLKLMQKIPPDL